MRPTYATSWLTKFCIVPILAPAPLWPLYVRFVTELACISSGSVAINFNLLVGLSLSLGLGQCPYVRVLVAVPVPVHVSVSVCRVSLGCLATMQCGGKMIKIRLHSGVKLTYIAAIYLFVHYTLKLRPAGWPST